MSLFGNTQNQNRPSLFTNNSQTSSGLFGQPQQQQPQQQTTSLFGQQQQSTQQPGNSLFGTSNQPQQQQQNSLFGSTAQQPQQQTNSLFGASTQQLQQQTNSLFGSSNQTQQQQPQNSLFGSTTQQQPQQQQQNSLFGSANQQPQQNSLFGSTNQQQQQQRASSNAPLWQPPSSFGPREKSIPEQMLTLMKKWSPDTQECLFQYYFYNNVGVERVPYYGPGEGEDEQKWEDALSRKPNENAVPVLCKGFGTLGERLRLQVQAVQGLQARLHEINNSLSAQQQGHDLDISVRAVDAKRRHIALSQRCLRLATKVQVLRNRGYVMDGSEEVLKRKLAELEKSTFDPSLSGRQDEIWARLLGVRERARLLQSEMDNSSNGAIDGADDSLDEEVLRKTKKILNDYDSQISHLHREIEEIRKDYQEWEDGSVTRRP